MGKRRGHGEGSIYVQRRDAQGKPSLWAASVTLSNGKRRCVYNKTRKGVADALHKLQSSRDAGLSIAADTVTVAQFLQYWLDTIVVHLRSRTRESYENVVRLHLVPAIGHYKLQKLTAQHVQAMVGALVEKPNGRGGTLSPRSVQYACLVLSRALNQAIDEERIQKNVADKVKLPEQVQRTIQPLSEEQAQALLRSIKGHRLEVLYRVALSLGLRRGEVLGLFRNDINFEDGRIMISGNLQRTGGKLVRSLPKTKKGQRTLPLPPMLAQALRAHIARTDEEQVEHDWKESPYLFVSGEGTPIEPRNLFRQLKRFLQKAGLPDISFHDLRHSCVAILIAQGVHWRTIMEILGHTDIRTTMNIYGHILPEVSQDAVDELDRLFEEDDEESDDFDADS